MSNNIKKLIKLSYISEDYKYQYNSARYLITQQDVFDIIKINIHDTISILII